MTRTFRLLLMEDSPSDARLVVELLSESQDHYDTERAERLADGLELLEQGGFDVVLLDLMLPDSSGFDTFREVQRRAGAVPVVILSGHGDRTQAEAAVLRGAQDFIAKNELDAKLLARSIRYAIARKRSEEKFRALLEGAPDAFVIVDSGGKICLVNQQAEKLFGYDRDEMLGQEIEMLIPHRFRQDHYKNVRQFFEQPKTRPMGTPLELLGLRNDGVEIPVEISLSPLETDTGTLVSTAIRDVTERRRAQQHLLAEQQLLRRLLSLRDREKQLIAYELHDGLLQYVIGAQMAVAGIAGRLGDDPAMADELGQVRRSLVAAIDEGRRMISELRPLIIDEEGILAAIEYLVGELGGRNIQVQFEHDVQFGRLSPLLEGALFRIVQEALSNIRRHSQADRAQIRMVQRDAKVVLDIEDQGVGFDPGEVPGDRFGVRGIRERARLFGGEARVESCPGRGTHIHVEMPLTIAPELSEALARGDPPCPSI